MTYPGGKNGAGVYQTIINQMPPHDVYIEAFLGAGAVMRHKWPAARNIGLDINENVARDFASSRELASLDLAMVDGALSPALFPDLDASAVIAKSGDDVFEIHVGDAIAFLTEYRFTGSELVYCDPPYLHSTRKVLNLYADEMSDGDHARLLDVLTSLPCRVMVSGYRSDIYIDRLSDWRDIQFQAQTRAGPAEEWLWMNFPEPIRLHDYRFLGANFRERERIKRKKARWTARLERMGVLERHALLSAIHDAWPQD